MVELVIVMIIIGVMAIVVAPRLSDLSTFDAAGFSDQLKASLRYAQKTAITHRRVVALSYVSDTEKTAALCSFPNSSACIDPDIGNDGVCDSGTQITLPGGSWRAAQGAVTAGHVCFDAVGRPIGSLGAALTTVTTITVVGAGPVSVEAETGYVR